LGFVVPGFSRAVPVPDNHAVDIDYDADLQHCEALLANRAAAANVRLLGREIGPGRPCFVIAEAGVNHNGDPALALQLIDAAAACGADAVKFQTFCADAIVTGDAPKAQYQVDQTGGGSQQDIRSAERPPVGRTRTRRLQDQFWGSNLPSAAYPGRSGRTPDDSVFGHGRSRRGR